MASHIPNDLKDHSVICSVCFSLGHLSSVQLWHLELSLNLCPSLIHSWNLLGLEKCRSPPSWNTSSRCHLRWGLLTRSPLWREAWLKWVSYQHLGRWANKHRASGEPQWGPHRAASSEAECNGRRKGPRDRAGLWRVCSCTKKSWNGELLTRPYTTGEWLYLYQGRPNRLAT